jgi:hypothetical protein
VEEIRNCVLAQIRLATYGVAARVDALQTGSGTNDKIAAQHWINILIQKSCEMQADTLGRDVEDILNRAFALGQKRFLNHEFWTKKNGRRRDGASIMGIIIPIPFSLSRFTTISR